MFNQKDLIDASKLYEECLEKKRQMDNSIATLKDHLQKMIKEGDYQTQYGHLISIETADLDMLHEIIGDMDTQYKSGLNEVMQSKFREEQAKRNRYSSDKPYGSNN